jgi:hypothetical protein
MKTILLLILPLVFIAAQEKKPAEQPKPKPASAITVPADATQIAPRVWRHTEKNGKTYIYRQTPFGLSKFEEQAVAPAAPASPPVEVKATDRGDTVHFEKPTPMGMRVWDRKKAELTEEEKDWLEKSKTPVTKTTAEK